MRRHLITFSGAAYEATTKMIVERGPMFGADDVHVYDDRWLTAQDFYRQNAWLWTHPHKRGFGWYAWKPYVIWHALQQCDDGDVVFYVDADCEPIANFSQLFDRCAQDGGVMLFASEGHAQLEWCKFDCYAAMGQGQADLPAGVARFMLFQKGQWKATQFLMEWLAYCVNATANTFDGSVHGSEHPRFIEHRAEQAIMTNLAHKYGLNLYREACEAGNGAGRDWGLYPQLFRQVNSDIAHVSFDPVGSRYFNVEDRYA
jgi:hypothetical protein